MGAGAMLLTCHATCMRAVDYMSATSTRSLTLCWLHPQAAHCMKCRARAAAAAALHVTSSKQIKHVGSAVQ